MPRPGSGSRTAGRRPACKARVRRASGARPEPDSSGSSGGWPAHPGRGHAGCLPFWLDPGFGLMRSWPRADSIPNVGTCQYLPTLRKETVA